MKFPKLFKSSELFLDVKSSHENEESFRNNKSLTSNKTIHTYVNLGSIKPGSQVVCKANRIDIYRNQCQSFGSDYQKHQYHDFCWTSSPHSLNNLDKTNISQVSNINCSFLCLRSTNADWRRTQNIKYFKRKIDPILIACLSIGLRLFGRGKFYINTSKHRVRTMFLWLSVNANVTPMSQS